MIREKKLKHFEEEIGNHRTETAFVFLKVEINNAFLTRGGPS